MNKISAALTQAGVKLPPLTQRIWQLLHDSKLPRSATCLASMLHVPRGNVSSTINTMYSRGMVALARHELTRVKGPRGTSSNRLVAQWAAVGQEYELLPVLPTTKAEPAANPYLVNATNAKLLGHSTPQPATINIEKMTLSEAHTLYKQLREFFGANND